MVVFAAAEKKIYYFVEDLVDFVFGEVFAREFSLVDSWVFGIGRV